MVLNDTNLNACKTYSLSWSEFSSSLSIAAQNLRHKEDFVDVTVSAGGKNFPAHKLVLGAASPLLMDLLKNTTCQHPILMLAGISAFDLETILTFVYHGEVNIDAKKLPSLLQAAQFLDIRALSPAALVLNSLPSSFPLCTTTVESKKTNNDDKPSQQNKIDATGSDETKTVMRKRKRHKKLVICREQKNISHSSVNNDTKHFKKSSDEANILELEPKITISHKSNESFTPTEGPLTSDEKKIVSDLPVICKLCGVTIRQSRNLRRHMDQMHSNSKSRKKDNQKEEKIMNKNDKVINVTSDSTPVLLDFSEESFNQFTEEIFNYTTMSNTSTNSFSNSSPTSSVTSADNCLSGDETQTTTFASPTQSALLYTLPSSSVVQSLNTLLGDICFHLPTTTTTVMTNTTTTSISDKKSTATNLRSSDTNFEYSHLETECCNSNEDPQDVMTYKEFDNQLLSACFCTSENDT